MAKTPQQRVSRVQEKGVVRKAGKYGLSGRNTPGSGNQWHSKSDAIIEDILRIELKTVVKPADSFSIKYLWIEKIDGEIMGTGRIPLLGFSFGYGVNYYVIHEKHIKSIIEELGLDKNGLRHLFYSAPSRPAKSFRVIKAELDSLPNQFPSIPSIIPALSFEFGNGTGRYFIIEESYIYEFAGKLKEIRH